MAAEQRLLSHDKHKTEKNVCKELLRTYKVESSNAHVYTALKMYLLIRIFPCAALQ